MGKKHPGTSGGKNYLTGFDKVMQNLRTEVKVIKSNSVTGLVKAVAFIREETEKQGNPMTPYDLGNLKRSWFSTSKDKVFVGYGAKQFKGNKADIYLSDHTQGITDAQGELTAMDTENRKHIMFGYTMKYSGFVHEMVGAHFQQKNGRTAESQWLQKNIYNNKSRIVDIIKENATIKK